MGQHVSSLNDKTGNLTAADVLGSVPDGANQVTGVATLVGGTILVNNTRVTANTRIFLTSQTSGAAPGSVRVSARVAGVSFTITSTSGTDTSAVAWMLVEPAV